EAKAAAGGAVAADVDGDGRLELILAHGGGHAAPLSLYRPTPNPNSWLRVAPLTAHGAPARGAIVSLWADGRRQRRVICAGSGHLCQMEPVAHFGLGTLQTVEQIEIQWPDGVAVTIDS
ncbi:ASPIC/UnbV domain-containing protein, partial [bacterium]|nr:ASPIC/UnbV domain-containing protein [bacterium]